MFAVFVLDRFGVVSVLISTCLSYGRLCLFLELAHLSHLRIPYCGTRVFVRVVAHLHKQKTKNPLPSPTSFIVPPFLRPPFPPFCRPPPCINSRSHSPNPFLALRITRSLGYRDNPAATIELEMDQPRPLGCPGVHRDFLTVLADKGDPGYGGVVYDRHRVPTSRPTAHHAACTEAAALDLVNLVPDIGFTHVNPDHVGFLA